MVKNVNVFIGGIADIDELNSIASIILRVIFTEYQRNAASGVWLKMKKTGR
jgi:hypothetical protein